MINATAPFLLLFINLKGTKMCIADKICDAFFCAVEVIVGNIPVSKVIETAKKTLYTGHMGDGKIFVYNVQQVVKVRTGEENLEALKDVE